MSRSDDWRIGSALQRVRDEEKMDRRAPVAEDDRPTRAEAEQMRCPTCDGAGFRGMGCPTCHERNWL